MMQEFVAETAGGQLTSAREAAGLSRSDVAARTRIAERHIAALEEGRYADLPGRTYAFGFARSLARALAIDETALLAKVRRELGMVAASAPPPEAPVFVPGDPARVPSARFAWIAGLFVLILGLGGGVWWKMWYEPGANLPSLLPPAAPAPAAPAPAMKPAAPAAVASPTPTAAPTGPVVFTAGVDRLWVKFSDASGKQLMQKQMALGETYTVPADAAGPTVWTGRPDALAITIGGKPVPKLSTQQKIVKDVPVSAAALLARAAAPAAPVAMAAPIARPSARVEAARYRLHLDADAATPVASPSPPPPATPAEPTGN